MEIGYDRQRRLRVLIAEDNLVLVSELINFLGAKPDIEIIGAERTGAGALSGVLLRQPDVLLLDLVMPDAEGMSVLEDLNRRGRLPNKVIIISSVNNDFFVQRAMQLGACYYLIKPFSMERLYDYIIEKPLDLSATAAQDIPNDAAADEQRALTAQLVDGFAMPLRLRGTNFLITAVMIARAAEGQRPSITKEIYPIVAKRYQVNAAQVERGIRNAIERAWLKGMMRQSGIFHGDRRPSNGEVIMTLAGRNPNLNLRRQW